MPPPNLLTPLIWGSGITQLLELVNGNTASQIGPDLAGGDRVALAAAYCGNLGTYSVNYKGETYVLAPTTTGAWSVYKQNEGGADNYGVVATIASTPADSGRAVTGLHVVKDGDDIALVFAWTGGTNDSQTFLEKTVDGTTWTTTTFNPGQSLQFGGGPSFTYRNKLYAYDLVTANALVEIDAEGTSPSLLRLPFPEDTHCADFTVMGDRLFAVICSGLATRYDLYELTGGGLTLNSVIDDVRAGRAIAGEDLGHPALFEDPLDRGKLIALLPGALDDGEDQGTFAARGTAAGTSFTWELDTTSGSTIPAGLAPGDRGDLDDARQDRWSYFLDNDDDPFNPVLYLIVAGGPAPGVLSSVLRWEGWQQEMGSGTPSGDPGPGVSVSTDHSIPSSIEGIARAISQGAASYAEIEQEDPVATGYQLSYRMIGLQTGLTGRVLYDDGQGGPRTVVTLVGGGTSFGPVDANDRATLETVVVDLSLSGITAPEDALWAIDLR